MFNRVDIGRERVLPIHNHHALTLKQVTLKADNLTNPVAVIGVKAVTNFGTNSEHLFSKGQPRPAGIIYQVLIPMSRVFLRKC